MQVTQNQLDEIAQEVELSMGEILVRHFPQIKSGDTDVLETFNFRQIIKNFTKHWLTWNSKEPINFK